MVIRRSLRTLALSYLEAGAFGDKEQPLSPVGLNLRTVDNPNRGPLTLDLIQAMGHKLWQEIVIDNWIHPYEFVAGLSDVGHPFAEALVRTHHRLDQGVELLHVREADHKVSDAELTVIQGKPRGTVLVVGDTITDVDMTMERIELFKRHEFNVCDVVVIIDTQQNGPAFQRLLAEGLRLHALFSLQQLRELAVQTKAQIFARC
ncbi:MAG TPA: hypothetical protein DDW41_00165 [Candidatus Andersenbacteria bacterium]|nr:hypothetical protein [Candidatus Andersenbacteria bacterium]